MNLVDWTSTPRDFDLELAANRANRRSSPSDDSLRLQWWVSGAWPESERAGSPRRFRRRKVTLLLDE